MTSDEMITLEGFVDSYGLATVLEKLAEICHEKADHVRTNWQDNNLAREWTKDAHRIETVSTKLLN